MRVIFMSRKGFSILVYHNVTRIDWNATANQFTVYYTGESGATTSIISNADYFIQIMGFTPVETSASGSSSSSENSGGSGGSGT